MKKPIGTRRQRTVFDSAGNKFEVVGFTKDIEGAISGFHLKGIRGEKEVGLSEYKFYTAKKKKG